MRKPIVYLYFHSKILNWKGKEMSIKEFKSSFFQWRIPKPLRDAIMKEMKKMDLIHIEGKRVLLNNYSFKEDWKREENFKDEDTKNGNPYVSMDYLSL